jgi:hypothetical protein
VTRLADAPALGPPAGVPPASTGRSFRHFSPPQLLGGVAVAALVATPAVLAVLHGARGSGSPLHDKVLLVYMAVCLGVVALPALLPRPRLAAAFMVMSIVTHASGPLGALGLPRPYLLSLAVATLVAGRGLHHAQLRLPPAGLLWATGLLVVVHTVPTLAATNLSAALLSTQQYVIGAGSMLVVGILASAPRGLPTVLSAALVGLSAVAALTIVHAVALPGVTDIFALSKQLHPADIGGTTARYSGPLDDPNFWGRDLALFVPFALTAAARCTGWRRAGSVASLGALLGGIYLTGSRGTLLALGAGVLVWLLLAGRRARRLLWLAPAVLVLLLSAPGVGSRLASLHDPNVTTAPDPSLTGRQNALHYGAQMFLDHPVTGVGPGNFLTAVRTYQRHDGDTSTVPIAPHDLYLELAAETGAGGLLVWVVFFGTGLRYALRARWQPPLTGAAPGPNTSGGSGATVGDLGDVTPRVEPTAAARLPNSGPIWAPPAVGGAAAAGLVAWAVASVFLHMADFDVLGLVVAAAGVGAATHRGVLPGMWITAPRLRRLAVALIAAAITFDVIATVSPLRRTQWSASFSLVVATSASRGSATPYAFDVSYRSYVVDTFATVLLGGAIDAPAGNGAHAGMVRTVRALPNSSLIAVTLQSAQPARSLTAANAALDGSLHYVNGLQGQYFLRPVEPSPVLQEVTAVQLAPLAEALGGAAIVGYGTAGTAAARTWYRKRRYQGVRSSRSRIHR